VRLAATDFHFLLEVNPQFINVIDPLWPEFPFNNPPGEQPGGFVFSIADYLTYAPARGQISF
jgi:hypothetical protein